MANEEAWNQGWKLGKGSSKGKKESTGKGKEAKAGKEAMASKAEPSTYKKGGKVRKTGTAKVHKGEIVLTAAQAKMCGGKPSKKKGARKRITTKE
jgi:hypothetical protein